MHIEHIDYLHHSYKRTTIRPMADRPVPTDTFEDKSSTSELYMRIQPWDTDLPIDQGSFVPWIP